jgi:hypothetical protein
MSIKNVPSSAGSLRRFIAHINQVVAAITSPGSARGIAPEGAHSAPTGAASLDPVQRRRVLSRRWSDNASPIGASVD